MQRVPQVMLDVNPHLILQCIWALECTLCTNKKGEQLFCVQKVQTSFTAIIYSSCINSPPKFKNKKLQL